MAETYDAVVIGSGVIGTATLFHLARLGCRRALLLERGPWLRLDDIDAIGFEAEAGFTDPNLVATGFARAARRPGAEIRTNTFAFGFSGDGLKLSPMIGRLLAQSMLWQPADLSPRPYRLSRFAEDEPLAGAYVVGAVS